MEPQAPTTPDQQPNTEPAMAPQPAPVSPEPVIQDVQPAPESPTMAPAPGTEQTPSPAPAAMETPVMNPAPAQAAPGHDPGHGMAIAGLIFAFLMPLVGLILSIVAKGKSKKVGMKNGLATAGLIISIIGLIGNVILSIIFLGSFMAVKDCADNATTTTNADGTTVLTCN